MGLSLVGARIERTCNGYFLKTRIPKNVNTTTPINTLIMIKNSKERER